ncbi:crAss001_48 related protein [Microbulbifer sp. 2201CG32-9]|uniref:crAss001_48 related protein n=1 Tax=Microbulbifer sp. 2201CG32-9 TaxID=3232309 RepID=UPI00345C07BB
MEMLKTSDVHIREAVCRVEKEVKDLLSALEGLGSGSNSKSVVVGGSAVAEPKKSAEDSEANVSLIEKSMSEFIDWLKKEMQRSKLQIETRICKLNQVLWSDQFEYLDLQEQELLIEQREVMLRYGDILAMRMKIHQPDQSLCADQTGREDPMKNCEFYQRINRAKHRIEGAKRRIVVGS